MVSEPLTLDKLVANLQQFTNSSPAYVDEKLGAFWDVVFRGSRLIPPNTALSFAEVETDIATMQLKRTGRLLILYNAQLPHPEATP